MIKPGISHGPRVKQLKTFEWVFVIVFDSETNVIFLAPVNPYSLGLFPACNFEVQIDFADPKTYNAHTTACQPSKQ